MVKTFVWIHANVLVINVYLVKIYQDVKVRKYTQITTKCFGIFVCMQDRESSTSFYKQPGESEVPRDMNESNPPFQDGKNGNLLLSEMLHFLG